MPNNSNFTVDEDFTIDVEEADCSIDLTGSPERCTSTVTCECGCQITEIVEDTRQNTEKNKCDDNKDECKNDMLDMIELKNSVMKGEVKGILQCPSCSYNTKKPRLFILHLDAHLKTIKNFTCEHCGYVTIYKNLMSMHKAKYHGGPKIKCPHCKYVTVKNKHLQKHLKKHQDDFTWNCIHCSFQTKDKNELQQHMKVTHKSKHQCKSCDFKTTQRKKLEAHIKIHESKGGITRKTVITCDLCDYESRYKANVLRHRISHLE